MVSNTTKEAKEKEKGRKEALGKYLYNLSQTCFTTMVVGIFASFLVTDISIGTFLIGLFMGIAATIRFGISANYILKK